MVASAKSLDIHFQQEACWKQSLALEQQAGIAETIGRAYDGRYLALPANLTKASCEENQEVLDSEREAIRLHIRRAYLSVSDLSLRKKLIAKFREREALKARYFQQEVYDAHARLNALNTSTRQWWLVAALCGAGLVGVGYVIFTIPGAIMGALAGLFLGRAMENADKHRRAVEVKQAEDDLAEAKSNLDQVASQAATFSHNEEISGEPDAL